MRSPFHIVSPSPWPVLSAISAFNLVVATVNFLRGSNLCQAMGPIWGVPEFPYELVYSLVLVVVCFYGWLHDVGREAVYCGRHTTLVQRGLKIGMGLFIFSEIMFFAGFFWAFFHSALNPGDFGLMGVWPPMGVNIINPMGVPLLNTAILLGSGFTITLAHAYLRMGEQQFSLVYLGVTVLLGLYFTSWQYMEYSEASFTIADSVYGSLFYVVTGFHGLHVVIGTIMLAVTWFRLYYQLMSSSHHVGFLISTWYWHFVDVVWIFVYLVIYWWGSVDSIQVVTGEVPTAAGIMDFWLSFFTSPSDGWKSFSLYVFPIQFVTLDII